MIDHLSPLILGAFADGELSADQLAQADEHLAICRSCASNALYQSLLKSATARAGQRYAPPLLLQDRLMRVTSQERPQLKAPGTYAAAASSSGSTSRFGMLGWATAAALLVVFAGVMFVQRNGRRADIAASERVDLIAEVFDQHIATLAGSQSPQVLSSDRHTVKPWFQGKLPFSFNLPESLPKDTTLDGANLTYLRNQPVAQLLYSIGRHRVSIFVREKTGVPAVNSSLVDHSGFHVMDSGADDLEMLAVSDVDPARLAELVRAIGQAQAEHRELLIR